MSRSEIECAPIIFFHDHTDPASFDALTASMKELKALGYRAISLEWDSDQSLEQAKSGFERQIYSTRVELGYLKAHKIDLSRAPKAIRDKYAICETIAAEHKNFGAVANLVEAHGLTYHGIDKPGLDRTGKSNANTSPRGMRERNEHMHDQMIKLARKYKGGVVFFVGAAHNGIQQLLRNSKTGRRFQSMLISSHTVGSPRMTSFEQTVRQPGSLGALARDAIYPMGITVVDSTNQDAAAAIVKTAKTHRKAHPFVVTHWDNSTQYKLTTFKETPAKQPSSKHSTTTLNRLSITNTRRPTNKIAKEGAASLAAALESKPLADALSL